MLSLSLSKSRPDPPLPPVEVVTIARPVHKQKARLWAGLWHSHGFDRALFGSVPGGVGLVIGRLDGQGGRSSGRRRLGGLAPKEITFDQHLPHTSSGKVMRRLLKARELGLPEGDVSTLEHPS